MLRLCLVVCLWATPAAALSPVPPAEAPSAVVPVQNRFLPGFLSGDDKPDDTQVRLDQLEAQVRMLTGQVEQLTFALRRMEAALANGAPAAVSRPGPGTPPRTLGTVPATPGDRSEAPAARSGPIDLSSLSGNNPAPTTARAAPATQSGSLQGVRDLQASGRYAMAADAARAVLAEQRAGPVANEARFLLGEALLSQRDFRGAANQFLENYTSDPNDPRAPTSLLRLSTALNGLGEREAACSSLDELLGAYPNLDRDLRAAAERERQTANCG
ncbi:MAG: tetratricopeptide repeat protein [Pseudomonadota bacterium]